MIYLLVCGRRASNSSQRPNLFFIMLFDSPQGSLCKGNGLVSQRWSFIFSLFLFIENFMFIFFIIDIWINSLFFKKNFLTLFIKFLFVFNFTLQSQFFNIFFYFTLILFLIFFPWPFCKKFICFQTHP